MPGRGRFRQTGAEIDARRSLRGPLALALLAVVTAFATANVWAAFSSSDDNPGNAITVGSVAISDNDSGSAMLSLSSAPLGTSDTSCIKTSYSGSLPSEVHHYVTASGALAPYLTLNVTRGTGANTFDNCSDFTADSTNYFGKGAGVIYDGKLSNYPTSWGAGIVDPASGGSYSSMVSGTSGLVSYWRLGDNAISADELDDSAGTILSNHTGQLGASWTESSGQARVAVFTNENRLRKETGDGAAQYYTSAIPSSANYLVEADVHVKSLLASDAIGVTGRMSTSTDTFYFARYLVDSGYWQLLRVVDGTSTSLGTYAQTLSSGQTYRLTLDMNGSTIRVLVDGVQRISATDANITAAGRGGIRLGIGNSTAQSTNTAGLHLDNFRVTSLSTTAADSQGTNTGTYAGGVRLNQPGALSGDSDRAALFDGTSGRVTVPNQAALQLTGNFSIEAWVKPNSVTGTRYLVNKGTFYYLYLNGSDVVFGFRSGGVYKWVVASGAASVGSWHHFVGTYNGATLSLYRNGIGVASAATSGAVDTSTANLFIGAISDTGSFFSGTMDEVALYNRALSVADVSTHYAARVAEVWSNPENHAYKFQITLDNDSAALGKSATATFHWEARNL
jgi:hypothetical protein